MSETWDAIFVPADAETDDEGLQFCPMPYCFEEVNHNHFTIEGEKTEFAPKKRELAEPS